MLTVLVGGDHPFLEGEFSLGGGGSVTPWVWPDAPKEGWSPPTEGCHHPKRLVTDFKICMKINVKFYLVIVK